MKVDLVPIDRVIPYARNPRKNDAAVAKVAASIREFGWRQPIVVDEQQTVIVGHTRLLAARQLGISKVPVHVAVGLSDAQVKAYRLADNRLHEEAEWDEALLGLELGELRDLGLDLSLTGFDAAEIAGLLHSDGQLQPGVDPDDAPDLPEEPRSHIGDLYALGPHRLLCGDSRSAEDVGELMDGTTAELLWTDPPYGVSYVGKTKRALKIQNDGADDLAPLLCAAFKAADTVMNTGARFYVASPAGPRGTEFRIALLEVGWKFHQGLAWVKDAMVLGHSDYHYRHEDVLYGWKPGTGRVGRGDHAGTRWFGDNAQTSVLEFPRPVRSSVHPTMKPVDLIVRCLANSSKPGDIVLDCFGGSGSTLIAAVQTGRVARLMELDPRYCDVIVDRWERATGERARYVRHGKGA